MPITTKKITEVMGKDVFTNKGIFCGRVVDMKINLDKFRMNSLVLDVARGSFLSDIIGDKKGVIVPYQHVESVGDVVIIKHISPSMPIEEEAKEEKPKPASIF